MQQQVTLIVACNSSGRELFSSAKKRLSPTGFNFDPTSLLKKSHLAFNLSYTDVWLMGDSFDRFLYPKSAISHFSKGSSELWTIQREKLIIRNTPRNSEEKFFKSLLIQARGIYRKASADSYLFLVRSVFNTSIGFSPEA